MLPPPINGTETYLAAVLEEIRGLRADVAELREEFGAPQTVLSGPPLAVLPPEVPPADVREAPAEGAEEVVETEVVTADPLLPVEPEVITGDGVGDPLPLVETEIVTEFVTGDPLPPADEVPAEPEADDAEEPTPAKRQPSGRKK